MNPQPSQSASGTAQRIRLASAAHIDVQELVAKNSRRLKSLGPPVGLLYQRTPRQFVVTFEFYFFGGDEAADPMGVAGIIKELYEQALYGKGVIVFVLPVPESNRYRAEFYWKEAQGAAGADAQGQADRGGKVPTAEVAATTLR